MERSFGLRLLALLAVVMLGSGCGVDAPPVPPGQDNPRDIQDPRDINVSGYF